jgi:hypothetical protein
LKEVNARQETKPCTLYYAKIKIIVEFVVKDDIEFAYLNVIPLWAFGLNY